MREQQKIAKKIELLVSEYQKSTVVLLIALFMCLGDVWFPLQTIWFLTTGWLVSCIRNLTHPDFSYQLVITILIGVAVFYFQKANLRPQLKLRSRHLKTSLFFFTITLLLSVVGLWEFTSRSSHVDEKWFFSNRSDFRYHLDIHNQLKNQGFAIHYYHSAHQTIPHDISPQPTDTPLHSWQTALLPYLSLTKLERKIDFEKPWSHPQNKEVFQLELSEFLIPGSYYPSSDPHSKYALTHFTGNSKLFGRTSPIKFDEFPDGLSTTIMLGTIVENLPPWGKPGNRRDPALGINKSPHGFGSPYRKGGYVVMADGSVRWINEKVSPEVMKALSTPNGNKKVLSDKLPW